MVATRTLSRSDLRSVAPSIFATEPFHAMSDRFGFVPTIDVIDMLADLDFVPVRANQSRTRIAGKSVFTKHVIRLRRTADLDQTAIVGAEVAELVLGNAHDGTAVYNLDFGMFRFVCTNGLNVASDGIGTVRIKHTERKNDVGGFQRRVIEETENLMDKGSRVLEYVQDWKSISLSARQRESFAIAAHSFRDDSNVNPIQLLAPLRATDRKNDLWTTFNVVQENMIKGGISGRSDTGRRYTTRPITNVTRDVQINKALWILAEELAKSV